MFKGYQCKNVRKVSSKDILNLIYENSQDKALRLVFKQFFPVIRAHLLKKGAMKSDIDDVFQDAVLVFYKKAKNRELKENTDVGSYLYTVSKNLWINKIQRDNKSVEFDFEPINNDVEHAPYKKVVDEEREESIKSIFAQLGAQCEELLINKFYHALSMKEIVEKMGFKNEDSVKSQHYKCKQKLLVLAKDNPWFINLLRSGN